MAQAFPSDKKRSISETAKSGRRVARLGLRSPRLQSRQMVVVLTPKAAAVSFVLSARRKLWPVAVVCVSAFTLSENIHNFPSVFCGAFHRSAWRIGVSGKAAEAQLIRVCRDSSERLVKNLTEGSWKDSETIVCFSQKNFSQVFTLLPPL